MRSGPHWTGYPPDDPPQGEHWCSECSRWDDECVCEPESDFGKPMTDLQILKAASRVSNWVGCARQETA